MKVLKRSSGLASFLGCKANLLSAPVDLTETRRGCRRKTNGYARLLINFKNKNVSEESLLFVKGKDSGNVSETGEAEPRVHLSVPPTFETSSIGVFLAYAVIDTLGESWAVSDTNATQRAL